MNLQKRTITDFKHLRNEQKKLNIHDNHDDIEISEQQIKEGKTKVAREALSVIRKKFGV